MSTTLSAESQATSQNIYLPELMEVIGVRQETSDVKSVKVRFKDEERQRSFDYRVGQFGLWSRFGSGESVFNICGSSTWKDRLEFCFRRVGRVTDAFWKPEDKATRSASAALTATGIRPRNGKAAT